MEAKKAMVLRGRVRVERGIYRQPNGKYAVCFMLAGKPRFRTVGGNLDAAHSQREALAVGAQAGALAGWPRLRFATVAGWWLGRFEAKVAAGERRERTLEAHRYQLEKQLLPALGLRMIETIGVDDVAEFLTGLRAKGCSEKTTAGALATLHSIVRLAIRNGWALEDPVSQLEADERPHPVRRRQRVLGRDEIGRLLGACLPRYRPLIATALMRQPSGRAASRSSRRAAARRSGTATSSAARWRARPESPGWTTAIGRRCASTTCATPSPAT